MDAPRWTQSGETKKKKKKGSVIVRYLERLFRRPFLKRVGVAAYQLSACLGNFLGGRFGESRTQTGHYSNTIPKRLLPHRVTR